MNEQIPIAGTAVKIPVPQLRPFFGYYGGKWRDALKHYPEPKHATIVEPFAGSAGFSLRHVSRNVILCEVDPVLAEVWRYLIRVKAKEILSIPDLAPDESVDDLKISQEAKWLVGFWLNRGTASPRKRPSKWMRDGIRPGSFWGERVRNTIAGQVDHIRHWQLHNCSYEECPTPRVATWFVDPPYQAAGKHYRFGSKQIDYAALGEWCRSRPGQVIVCENEGATWLPFRELADVKTTRAERRSKEVFWLDSFEDDDGDRRPVAKRHIRTKETTMTNLTGYVACNYLDGDSMESVDHGEIRDTSELAQVDARMGAYQGVRYVHTDGYLYVDRPE